MSIDWTLLDPGFIVKCMNLLNSCEQSGFTMVPYFGQRSLEAQAKLWRQSRYINEIEDKITYLKNTDCDYLATILDNVGPQSGKWATNALPGFSWHNWGQALDCYYLNEGKADWTTIEAYNNYGKIAHDFGLTWGGNFSHKDPGHIQFLNREIPQLYDIKYVNDYFQIKDKK